MASEPPDAKPRFERVPQLRHGFYDERQRLGLLTAGTIAATIVIGACCSFAWNQEPNVGSGSLIAIQIALIGLWWWWLAFRLTYYTFTLDLKRDLGRHGTMRAVMNEIDAELRTIPDVFVRGRFNELFVAKDDYIALTPHWMVQVAPYRAAVIRLDDLVWFYKRVIARRVWVRSASYRIQLACRLRDGSVRYVEGNEEWLDELAEELLERRPGVLVGWGGENFDLAAPGPAALTAAYEGRAGRFAELPPEQSEAWLDEGFERYENAVHHVE